MSDKNKRLNKIILAPDEMGNSDIYALIFSSWMSESGENIKSVFSTLQFSMQHPDAASIWVYFDGSHLYGFAFFTRSSTLANAVRLNYLAVNPLYRRTGLGKEIIEDAKRNFNIINLISSNKNTEFYKKCGFFEAGTSNDNKKIMFYNRSKEILPTLNSLEFVICGLNPRQVDIDWKRIKYLFLTQLKGGIGDVEFNKLVKLNGVNLELINRTT